MRSTSLISCLALLLPLGAAAAPPPPKKTARPASKPAAQRPQDVFAGDARLRKKLTVAEKDRPLSDLLEALGRRVGAPLAAAPDVADDKATLFLDERPALEVLQLLATHFGFQWSKNGTGYRLSQSAPARQREQELLDKEAAALRSRIEQRMRLLARLSSENPLQLQARLRQIDTELGGSGLLVDEHARLTEEKAAVSDLLRPGAAAAVAVYASLDFAQLQRLRTEGILRLSTFNGSLAPPLAEQVHAAVQALMKDPGWKLDPRKRQADVVLRLTDFTGPRTQPQTAHVRRLRLEVEMVSGDGKLYRPLSWSPVFAPDAAAKPRVSSGDEPVLKRTLSLPAPASMPRAERGRTWPEGLTTLSAVAEALHRDAGLEVVADSFTRARLDSAALAGKTVLEALDGAADLLGCDWRKEGKVVFLRSRVYYRDRQLEVPSRLLAGPRAQLLRDGQPSLLTLAGLAGALSDTRLRSLYELWGWYLEGTPAASPAWAELFYPDRRLFRLIGALSAEQRARLLRKQILPLQQMTSPQQQAFAAALTARAETSTAPMSALDVPSAQDLAAGGLSLVVTPMERRTYAVNGPTGRRLEFSRVVEVGDAALPRVAGGASRPEPVGGPVPLRRFTFGFHLAGRPRPGRTITLDLPGSPGRK